MPADLPEPRWRANPRRFAAGRSVGPPFPRLPPGPAPRSSGLARRRRTAAARCATSHRWSTTERSAKPSAKSTFCSASDGVVPSRRGRANGSNISSTGTGLMPPRARPASGGAVRPSGRGGEPRHGATGARSRRGDLTADGAAGEGLRENRIERAAAGTPDSARPRRAGARLRSARRWKPAAGAPPRRGRRSTAPRTRLAPPATPPAARAGRPLAVDGARDEKAIGRRPSPGFPATAARAPPGR